MIDPIGAVGHAAAAEAANATAREVVVRTGMSALLQNLPEVILGAVLSGDGG